MRFDERWLDSLDMQADWNISSLALRVDQASVDLDVYLQYTLLADAASQGPQPIVHEKQVVSVVKSSNVEFADKQKDSIDSDLKQSLDLWKYDYLV